MFVEGGRATEGLARRRISSASSSGGAISSRLLGERYGPHVRRSAMPVSASRTTRSATSAA
jgi:hypothetical protein